MPNEIELYGQGLRFPLVIAPGFDWIAGPAAVAQALRTVLLTQPGERIGRPAFGVGLRRFLFEPNTPATRALIRQAVIDAIERDEARVRLNDVMVTADSAEPTLVRIDVRYSLVADPTPRTFVFPFYLEQG